MSVERSIKMVAEDLRVGMTLGELREMVVEAEGLPSHSRLIPTVSIGGKVKALEIQP